MRIAVIAFSKEGAALGSHLKKLPGHKIKNYIILNHAGEATGEPFDSVYALSERLFSAVDGLVFIGACGIAVRAIAPLLKNKLTDPAVVVCDETGSFAISLLSGHAGGANHLAQQIAAHIGATPVITTASDAQAILADTKPLCNLVLGIGCRRGLAAVTIERAATIMLWQHKIPLQQVCEVATIDVKRAEEGLLGFVQAHQLPLRFFSAAELARVTGEFTHSGRVLQAVGVDNVCERAAVLCGGAGRLIMRKTAKDGVTVAVFAKE